MAWGLIFGILEMYLRDILGVEGTFLSRMVMVKWGDEDLRELESAVALATRFTCGISVSDSLEGMRAFTKKRELQVSTS